MRIEIEGDSQEIDIIKLEMLLSKLTANQEINISIDILEFKGIVHTVEWQGLEPGNIIVNKITVETL